MHDYAALWKSRSFLTSQGKPTKNAAQIIALIEAITLSVAVAVINVKVHTRGNDLVTIGNRRADEAAKEAALFREEGRESEKVCFL